MTVVRQATAADVPTLLDLMAEFYGESSYPLDRAWAAQAFGDLLEDSSRGMVWLLEVDGAPAGHMVLSVRFAMEFGGLLGYIDDLFVKQRLSTARRGARRARDSARGLPAPADAARFTSRWRRTTSLRTGSIAASGWRRGRTSDCS